MKKSYAMSVVGAGIAAAAVIGTMKARSRNQDGQTIEDTLMDAGMPDQSEDRGLAQQENAKMVSEGSQFGVQYFNDVSHMPEENE